MNRVRQPQVLPSLFPKWGAPSFAVCAKGGIPRPCHLMPKKFRSTQDITESTRAAIGFFPAKVASQIPGSLSVVPLRLLIFISIEHQNPFSTPHPTQNVKLV